MSDSYIHLDAWQVAVAAVLVLTAAVTSLLLKLDLEKRLGVAVVRMTAQLLLIGFVLDWIFAAQSPFVIAAIITVMVGVASRAAIKRPSRTFDGIQRRAFGTLVLAGVAVTFLATGWILCASPWWEPQYLIPMLGMVLGNSLTGISLCLDHLLETLDERRGEVEMELALGASRWEAARGPLAAAVKRALIPTINTMSVMGLVSLPGMMTGQILAGAKPTDAVLYQIVIMFMIAAAVSLGCIGLSLQVYRRMFNERHQLVQGVIRRQ